VKRRIRLWLTPVVTAVAVVLGVLGATLPGHVPAVGPQPGFEEQNIAAARASTPGDRVEEAAAGVQRTGFYIAPELRGQLTASETSRIEQALAGAEVPAFLVWWKPTADAGYNTEYAALDQLRARVGVDGFYAVVAGTRSVLVGTVGYDDVFIDASPQGRPGPALLRIAEDLAAQRAARPAPPGERSDYWGGPGGGLAAGLLMVGLGYAVVLLAIWITGRLVRGRGGKL
jgi:hypothetical protein